MTGDGSHSLYHSTLNEHYHSQHGAIAESRHVFLKSGFDIIKKRNISILEFGFGTGLNAILTQQTAEQRGISVNYTSLEKYPLPQSIWKDLNYAHLCGVDVGVFERMHQSPWEDVQRISPHFNLLKRQIAFKSYQAEFETYDIIYFDAFAPNHQAEVWSSDILKSCYLSLKAGGIWVSYCAQGEVRRRLQSVGFTTERIPGPPGKREMLRGRKL